jgi:L-ascorbate metabolism protein UlaG (beta-lactamase superfamily)
MPGWPEKLGRAALIGAAMALAGCNPLVRPSLGPYQPLLRDPPARAAGAPQIWFLGSSTLVLRDGATTIMIDGFFSRPRLPRMVLRPRSVRKRVDGGLALGGFRREAPDAAALFVAHSHHDHALDSSVVANRLGAILIGSPSSLSLALGDDPPAKRICLAGDRDQFEFGPFTVTVFETPHSEGALRTILGEVTKPPPRRRSLSDYKALTSHAYHIEHRDGLRERRILIVPSANYALGSFVTPQHPNGVPADVVFLAVAKLNALEPGEAEEYWRRSVTATRAKLVIPIHWDDIMRPLEKKGRPRDFKTIPYAQDDFHAAMRIIMPLALRDGVELRLPRRAGPVDIEARTGPGPTREIEQSRNLLSDVPLSEGAWAKALPFPLGPKLERGPSTSSHPPRLKKCPA